MVKQKIPSSRHSNKMDFYKPLISNSTKKNRKNVLYRKIERIKLKIIKKNYLLKCNKTYVNESILPHSRINK